MKQLQLDLKKRLLIVDAISKGIADAWVFNNYGLKTMMNSVCKGLEFTEEKARLYIEPTNRIYSPKGWEFWFKDFTDDAKHKTSALEAFISAIEVAGYFWGENPMKKPEHSIEYYDSSESEFRRYESDSQKWEELESLTFNPETSIIFEILK